MVSNFLHFDYKGKSYGVRFFPTTHVIRSIVRYVHVRPMRWDREPYVRTFKLKEERYPEIWEAAEYEIARRDADMRRISAEVEHEAHMMDLEDARKRDAIVLAEEIGGIVGRYLDDCNKVSELGGTDNMRRSAVNKMCIAYRRFADGAVKKAS